MKIYIWRECINLSLLFIVFLFKRLIERECVYWNSKESKYKSMQRKIRIYAKYDKL